MLLESLLTQIKTEADAASLEEAAERALREDLGFATAQMEAIISAAERRVVTEALLPLLGPIAPVLVARYAEKAVGADDFYRRLADTISSEKDRASFLKIRALNRDGQQ